jgi:methionyl aminopeptidase
VSRLVLKSPAEIDIMDQASRIVRTILDEIAEKIRPGVSTMDLDRFAEGRVREMGGIPAFKGYPHRGDGRDFPGTLCTSLNSEVVHGIPSDAVTLSEGDILSVDLGVLHRGYYGDAAMTYPVGRISDNAARLLQVTRESLDLGIRQARAGNRVSDIGHAVQSHVEGQGFSVVRQFVGHGIGSQLHEEPQIPNLGPPGRLSRLVEGMVLAIEPMVNAGSHEVQEDDDGWTARTRDGSLSAHFEACVAVTADGPRMLGVQRGAAA